MATPHEADLTPIPDSAINGLVRTKLQDVRCPKCGHLRFRYYGTGVYIEHVCKSCKQKFVVTDGTIQAVVK